MELGNIIRYLNDAHLPRIEDGFFDYNTQDLIFSLSGSILRAPFFNIQRLVDYLNANGFRLIVGNLLQTVFIGCKELFNGNENYFIGPIEFTDREFEDRYKAWREKYTETKYFTQV